MNVPVKHSIQKNFKKREISTYDKNKNELSPALGKKPLEKPLSPGLKEQMGDGEGCWLKVMDRPGDIKVEKDLQPKITVTVEQDWTPGQNDPARKRAHSRTPTPGNTPVVKEDKSRRPSINIAQALREKFLNTGMNFAKRTQNKRGQSLKERAKLKQAEWRKEWEAKNKKCQPERGTLRIGQGKPQDDRQQSFSVGRVIMNDQDQRPYRSSRPTSVTITPHTIAKEKIQTTKMEMTKSNSADRWAVGLKRFSSFEDEMTGTVGIKRHHGLPGDRSPTGGCIRSSSLGDQGQKPCSPGAQRYQAESGQLCREGVKIARSGRERYEGVKNAVHDGKTSSNSKGMPGNNWNTSWTIGMDKQNAKGERLLSEGLAHSHSVKERYPKLEKDGMQLAATDPMLPATVKLQAARGHISLTSGTSGTSGTPGTPGTSGIPGTSGTPRTPGTTGTSGTSRSSDLPHKKSQTPPRKTAQTEAKGSTSLSLKKTPPVQMEFQSYRAGIDNLHGQSPKIPHRERTHSENRQSPLMERLPDVQKERSWTIEVNRHQNGNPQVVEERIGEMGKDWAVEMKTLQDDQTNRSFITGVAVPRAVKEEPCTVQVTSPHTSGEKWRTVGAKKIKDCWTSSWTEGLRKFQEEIGMSLGRSCGVRKEKVENGQSLFGGRDNNQSPHVGPTLGEKCKRSIRQEGAAWSSGVETSRTTVRETSQPAHGETSQTKEIQGPQGDLNWSCGPSTVKAESREEAMGSAVKEGPQVKEGKLEGIGNVTPSAERSWRAGMKRPLAEMENELGAQAGGEMDFVVTAKVPKTAEKSQGDFMENRFVMALNRNEHKSSGIGLQEKNGSVMPHAEGRPWRGPEAEQKTPVKEENKSHVSAASTSSPTTGKTVRVHVSSSKNYV